MFDHVTIRAADPAASLRFYEATLGAAGIAAWPDFRIETGPSPTQRLHIGFSVAGRDHVHAFWDAGVAAGYTDDGAPGLRPEYTGDYYGGFLLDPDGNSAEAVHHRGIRRSGIVDHVWMRVADLDASRRFYDSIATDAGYRLNKELPGRVAYVSERPDGGDFSIVEGEPTRNAHLAFPAGRADALTDPDGNTVELVRA
ncbi:MAG TPA: VOC family protein [Thermoleophilaceae bacterium]|nr:VOC family protein [Thermoleophilaceae bacterium]